jgi:hypothetical protein
LSVSTDTGSTSTDPNGDGVTLTDQQIAQLLNGAGAGSAPAVPGYSSSTSGLNTMSMGGFGGPQITVAGNTLTLSSGITGTSTMPTGEPGPNGTVFTGPGQVQQALKAAGKNAQTQTITQALTNFYNQINTDTTFKDQFAQQAKQAGLISSATASKGELLIAFQAVAEEAVSSNQSWQQVLQSASTGGWTSIQPNRNTTDYGLSGTGNLGNAPDSSTSTTETDYVSYMDPATAQGALADSYYRLLGREPTSQEYQAFLTSLYSYQNNVNQGTYETTQSGKSGDAQSGTDDVTQKNEITQRGVGTRGAAFLASQQAMEDPSYAPYQAATTYFNAFMKALSGPASGMEGSGPDVTAP